jgi:hypothetical protein
MILIVQQILFRQIHQSESVCLRHMGEMRSKSITSMENHNAGEIRGAGAGLLSTRRSVAYDSFVKSGSGKDGSVLWIS